MSYIQHTTIKNEFIIVNFEMFGEKSNRQGQIYHRASLAYSEWAQSQIKENVIISDKYQILLESFHYGKAALKTVEKAVLTIHMIS